MKKNFIFVLSLLAIAFNAQAQIASYVPLNGLKAWYPFSSNISDQSGAGNNLTGSINYVTDRFGVANSAISDFTPTSPLTCTAPNFIFGYDSAFTTSVWVDFYGLSGSGGLILKHGITTALASDFVWYMSGAAGGNPSFAASVTTPWTSDTYPFGLPMNDWLQLVAVYDTGVMKLYMNSQLVATQSLAASSSATTHQLPFWIGYDQWDNTVMDSINIDDIGVWNRALADCEISKLYFSTTTLITNVLTNDTVLVGGSAHYSITDTGGTASYEWQQSSTGTGFSDLIDGGAYSGTTTKNLNISPVNPLMNNYQYRCIRNSDPCSDTSNVAKLIVNTTDVSSVNLKNQVSIFPNPTQNKITINSSASINTIVINDVLGKKVFEGHNESKAIDIDVSGFAPGIYIVKVNGTYTNKFLRR